MVEITDRESLDAWLDDRPREDQVLIEARAALRVLPVVELTLGEDDERRRAAIVLPLFRAGLSARCAGTWPDRLTENRGRRARTSAASAAYGAFAAADAANAAYEGVRTAAYADRQSWANVAADAAALQDGTPHEQLGQAKLWRDEIPDWASKSWTRLRRSLLDSKEGWEVWTDWYDSVREGRRFDPDLELRKVIIPEDIWQQGPVVVNAEIARLTVERARWKHAGTPTSAKDRVSERSFEQLLSETADAVRSLPDPQIVLPGELKSAIGSAPSVKRVSRSAVLPPSNEPHPLAPPTTHSVQTVAFFSYTRSDDRLTRGVISAIRAELEDAVSLYHGAPLEVFQDTEDIEGGQIWRARLDQALVEATIFVPLITPAFFNSVHCREELARFLARGHAGTLVLPIHFIDTDFAASAARDELRAATEERQWLDWRPHQRQIRINKRLRDDIHAAARLILTRWRAARTEL